MYMYFYSQTHSTPNLATTNVKGDGSITNEL